MARLVGVGVSWLLLVPAAGRGQACAEPHYRWSEKVDTTLQTRPDHPAGKVDRDQVVKIRADDVQHRKERHEQSRRRQYVFVAIAVPEQAPRFECDELTQHASGQPRRVLQVAEMEMVQEVDDE